jgi:glutathione synthase/RimK-type ligase-like ATP-grasp enzyme
MEFDIVLLTEKKYINPEKVDWYTEQVLTEDRLVKEALEAKGFEVTKKAWCDPYFDWSTTRAILFRTTWDYFNRLDEFLVWLADVSQKTKLINPYPQIKWNLDKHYLLDLKEKGIPVVESYFIKKGTKESLTAIHKKLGLVESVLKPTVSGAARHTYRLTEATFSSHEALFEKLIQKEDFIIQPFQKNILSKGEVSHIVIGGNYAHSILKIAKPGDYRVQDDFGGSIHLYATSLEERKFAEKAVKACSPTPCYARVDVIWDNNDALALSEIELIEPELWFRKNPKAARDLADAITHFYF